MYRLHQFEVDGTPFTFDGEDLTIRTGVPQERSNGSASKTARKSFLRSVALVLNNDCNMRCDYCYANHGNFDSPGRYLSFADGRAAIDLLADSLRKHNSKRGTIGFFGGEPLLSFDRIRKLTEYAETVVPDFTSLDLLITTNATLLTSEMADFFAQKRFKVTVSIDGAQRVNDASRIDAQGGGTYQRVVEAIGKLLARKVEIIARITVSEKNPDVFAAVQHVSSLGLTRITFADDYSMGKDSYGKYLSSLGKLVDWYFDQIRTRRIIDITNFTEPLSAIATKSGKVAHCNAGVSYIAVSADGQVYRCPRFVGNSEFKISSNLSSASSELDVSIERLKTKLGKDAGARTPECDSCSFVKLCGGVCFYHSQQDTGNEFARSARDCSYRKRLYRQLLENLVGLSTPERRCFYKNLIELWSQTS